MIVSLLNDVAHKNNEPEKKPQMNNLKELPKTDTYMNGEVITLSNRDKYILSINEWVKLSGKVFEIKSASRGVPAKYRHQKYTPGSDGAVSVHTAEVYMKEVLKEMGIGIGITTDVLTKTSINFSGIGNILNYWQAAASANNNISNMQLQHDYKALILRK